MRRSKSWTSSSNDNRNLPATKSDKAYDKWTASFSTGDLSYLGPPYPWVQPPVD
ncbi:mCG1026732 [Mus musculus]|uniref:Predicted gene 3646 n=1 Tax=Mus spicilegus TaxID=10103 RepID=A0A8C6HSU8_MUSSI|nr:mCG1026732 [Mus musculus]|eukprot:NP_001170819.1 uncharacterized protein LOC100042065 [Mus musculus]